MRNMKSGTYGRLPYTALDVMPVPGDVPVLGIGAGEGGQIQSLDLRRNGTELVALVRVPYSTGQTRGLLEVPVPPRGGAITPKPA